MSDSTETMRKLVIILLFCLPALLGFKLVIGQFGPCPSYIEQTDSTTVKVDSTKVVQQVPPKPALRGKVEVSFRIDDEGEVEIININSDNPELINYVVKRLKKIKLDPEVYHTGQVIKYKFDFNQES